MGQKNAYAIGVYRPLGHTFTFSEPMVKNVGNATVTVERVLLDRPDPGLKVLDVRALRGAVQISDPDHWPPRGPRGERSLPARGLRIPPALRPKSGTVVDPRGVNLVLRVRANRVGRYRARGVLVDYRAGDQHYQVRLLIGLTVCAARRPPHSCRAVLPWSARRSYESYPSQIARV